MGHVWTTKLAQPLKATFSDSKGVRWAEEVLWNSEYRMTIAECGLGKTEQKEIRRESTGA